MASEKNKKYDCCGGDPKCSLNITSKFIDNLFELYDKSPDAAKESLFMYMASVETDRDFYRAKYIETITEHNRDWVMRSWGKYKILNEGPGYKTKLLIVTPYSKSKTQRHFKRKEVWTFVSGPLYGHTLAIDKKEWHQLKNDTSKDLIIIETQLGECEEEDIERK